MDAKRFNTSTDSNLNADRRRASASDKYVSDTLVADGDA